MRVFGIARAGAVWCPINPRNEAEENREILQAFDCRCLLYQKKFEPLVDKIRGQLPQLEVVICLDNAQYDAFIADVPSTFWQAPTVDDTAMIVGTGGTTGRPKGVMLTGVNLETMTALTLMGYPFNGRPVYLALAPLTHAAGVLCVPDPRRWAARSSIMPKADHRRVPRRRSRHHRVTHTFLPPTLIYMLLEHPSAARLHRQDHRCSASGTAPRRSPAKRLEDALHAIWVR